MPDQITHECVPAFTPSTLLMILSLAQGQDVPRCRFKRQGLADHAYGMFSFVFSPTQLGIPSDRKRRYTQFNLAEVLDFASNQEDLEVKFKAIFFRRLIIDASVYLVATEDMLIAHRRRLARKDGWDWFLEHLEAQASEDARSADVVQELLGDALCFIPYGLRNRICSYLLLARERGLLSGAIALTNLTQNASFSRQFNYGAALALLRGSYLFDWVTMRDIIPMEHWLIMGFPVPGVVSADLSANFPFPPTRLGHVLRTNRRRGAHVDRQCHAPASHRFLPSYGAQCDNAAVSHLAW